MLAMFEIYLKEFVMRMLVHVTYGCMYEFEYVKDVRGRRCITPIQLGTVRRNA